MKPAKIELKIDNVQVPSPAIESIQLKQPLGDHHTFVVELRRRQEIEDAFGRTMEDNLNAWLSKTLSLKITASDSSSGDSGEVRFVGVVSEVSFESKVDSLGIIRLKGYSPSIMLDLNKMYHAWCEMTSGDIISKLIGDANLPNANVAASGGTNHLGLLAYGDTPYQMINYLAGYEGWWAYYDGLNFNVLQDLSDDKLELAANDLDRFAIGLDSSRLKKVTGSSYEFLRGSWFSSDSQEPSPSGLPLGRAAGAADMIAETPEKLLPAGNLASQRDLDNQLNSAAKKSYSGLVKAKGSTDRLGLAPGKGLKVTWEPTRRTTDSRGEDGYSGLYLVTSVEHTYKDAKYSAEFKASARDLAFPYYKEDRFPKNIVETAWVTDVSDPEGNKLARVKVRLGWDPEGADGVESPFIRVCQPQAGANGDSHGTWILPEVGDGVLVSIRGRHLENAAVIGSLYDGAHQPRAEMYSDDNMIKALYTKAGNEIIIKDAPGEEQIMVKAKHDTCTFTMDSSDKETISMAVNSDGASFVMEGKSGSEKITLSSGGSTCEIAMDGSSSGGSIKIESQKSITLKANEINLEANSALNIKSSARMTQEANATFDIKSSGTLTVKGSLVQIN